MFVNMKRTNTEREHKAHFDCSQFHYSLLEGLGQTIKQKFYFSNISIEKINNKTISEIEIVCLLSPEVVAVSKGTPLAIFRCS